MTIDNLEKTKFYDCLKFKMNKIMTTDGDKLIGTWKLLSFELINKTSDKIFYPYGKNPIGTLIFSVDNFMTVTIMADNRENLSVESIQMATEQEKIKTIESYLSYSGTWRIDNDKIFVTVLVSLLPNWTNKEHYRHFKISGNKLTFQTPTMKQGDNEIYIELSWTKA